jgi:hypothetical protein
MQICLSGPESFDIFKGHSKATMILICNNAAQGILSSFFFKYAGSLFGLYNFFLISVDDVVGN